MALLIRIIVQLLTIVFLTLLKGPFLLLSTLISTVTTLATITILNLVDFTFFLINLITPRKAKATVVANGDPGYQGIWPEFQPPNPNFDSRSPCPYLSAFFVLSSPFLSHSREEFSRPTFPCWTWNVYRCVGQPWYYQPKWTRDFDEGVPSCRCYLQEPQYLVHFGS